MPEADTMTPLVLDWEAYQKGRKQPAAAKVSTSGFLEANVRAAEYWMERSEAHGHKVFAARAKVGVVDGRPVVRMVPTRETGPDTLELKRSEAGGGFTCDFAAVLGALGVKRLERSFLARVELSEDARIGKAIDLVLGTSMREFLRKRSVRRAAPRRSSAPMDEVAAGEQKE